MTYKPIVDQSVVDAIEIDDKGKCQKCPFMGVRFQLPWCRLTDQSEPEYRECTLREKKIFKGVEKK